MRSRRRVVGHKGLGMDEEVILVPAEPADIMVPAEPLCVFVVPDDTTIFVVRGDDVATSP